MGISLSHDDFKKDVLSSKAVALVSEFALIIYRTNGILIDVESDDAILHVFRHAAGCRDPRLRSIYLHIKTEFCMNLLKVNSERATCRANTTISQAGITKHRKDNIADVLLLKGEGVSREASFSFY